MCCKNPRLVAVRGCDLARRDRGKISKEVEAMMERRNYKGRVIDARTMPVQGGGWMPQFNIEHHRVNDVRDTRFESRQVFLSEKDALEAAISMGEQKIDSGYVHGFST